MTDRRILFITWDGPQVNYLETLFLPIFRALKEYEFDTEVLQFHWSTPDRVEVVAGHCRQAGIGYLPVRVSRSLGPIGPLFSALAGSKLVREAVERLKPDIVMPRSHLPALAALAAGTGGLPPICFDADGLPADERVDFAGLSRRSATFRTLVGIEAAMVRRSKAVLVRTPFAATVLAERAEVSDDRFHVVTNGRDERLFAPGSRDDRSATRRELDLDDDVPLLVYLGSIGPQYRFDLMAATAGAVRQHIPNSRLLVLTADPDRARDALKEANSSVLSMADVRCVRQDDVPRFIAAADLGLSFRARTFSMRAVSPIKTGEYLLCGVPVLGTAGIGDTAPAELAGVFEDESIGADAAAQWLAGTILPNRENYRELSRSVGVNGFSLARSVTEYLHALGPFR